MQLGDRFGFIQSISTGKDQEVQFLGPFDRLFHLRQAHGLFTVVDHHANCTSRFQALRQDICTASARIQRIHVGCQHEQVLRILSNAANFQCRADEQNVDVVLLCGFIGSDGVLQQFVAPDIVLGTNFKIRYSDDRFHRYLPLR